MRSTQINARGGCLTEWLEPRRQFAAAVVTAVMGADGVIVITGTRRADEIAVLEHFPGVTIYDVFANGALLTQFGGGNAIRIDGRGGSDALSVAPGITLPATILGGGGNDRITGGGGPDTLDGGAGGDVLAGGAGADMLLGRQGNDTLDGGDQNDALDGGAGRDNILGGAGDDVLTGGGGPDTLNGGDGNDALTGGGARDLLTGGDGTDTFAGGDSEREITDLTPEDSH